MPLTTVFTSHDANSGADDVNDQNVMLHLITIIVDLRDIVVPLMTPMTSCGIDIKPVASHD